MLRVRCSHILFYQIMSDDNCLDAASGSSPVKLVEERSNNQWLIWIRTKVRCHGLGGNQAWDWGDGGSIRHRCCLNKQYMLFLIKSCHSCKFMFLFLFSVSGKCLASNPGQDSPFLETCSGEMDQKWQLGGSIAWKSEDQWSCGCGSLSFDEAWLKSGTITAMP